VFARNSKTNASEAQDRVFDAKRNCFAGTELLETWFKFGRQARTKFAELDCEENDH